MRLFSADPENMKKTPSRVAHNRPNLFFSTGQAAKTAQNKSCTTKTQPINAGLGV